MRSFAEIKPSRKFPVINLLHCNKNGVNKFRVGYNIYITFTNFSKKYLAICKVYTDVSGIKYLYYVCPPVRKIIHSVKFVDYLHVQADNP